MKLTRLQSELCRKIIHLDCPVFDSAPVDSMHVPAGRYVTFAECHTSFLNTGHAPYPRVAERNADGNHGYYFDTAAKCARFFHWVVTQSLRFTSLGLYVPVGLPSNKILSTPVNFTTWNAIIIIKGNDERNTHRIKRCFSRLNLCQSGGLFIPSYWVRFSSGLLYL